MLKLFHMYVPVPFLLLVVIEGVIFYGSVYLGALIRFQGDPALITASFGAVAPKAFTFALFMLVGTGAMGGYDRAVRDYNFSLVLRLAVGLLVGLCGLALFIYIFPDLYFGRGMMVISASLSLFMIVLARFFFQKAVDEDVFKRRVVVVGAGERASLIDKRLRRKADRRSFKILGYLPSPNDPIAVSEDQLLSDVGSLFELCQREQVQDIVIAVDDRRGGLDMQELLNCRLEGVQVVELISFFERESGRVILDLLSPGWLVFSKGFRSSVARRLIKRGFDLIASGTLLLLTVPIMLLAACAIAVETGRPIFYRQVRVGRSGREFQLTKFRSMRSDAEQDGKARWATTDDDRITRVGRFLRQSRIDELPQIINVFRGDMSFVGPRPERPEFVESLAEQIPFYRERHCVNPGITGWAQLCYPYGSSVKDAAEKLKYDLYYVKNHTLLFDINILVRTVEVILFGKGAR